jgi:hypothetical protein
LGYSQSTVNRLLTKHNYETFTGRIPTPGPARKTTKHDDRHLIQIAKDNHRLPFRDIKNLSGLPISAKTVARRCKEVALISQYPCRKPFLTPKHKTDRLEWAMKYNSWEIDHWMKVIWSDEALMRIGQDPRRQCILRVNGTSLDNANLAPAFKSQRVTIVIWACFPGKQLGPCLTFEQGGIGSEEYMDILYEGLIPVLDDLRNHVIDDDYIEVRDQDCFLFMHDNAPCHKTAEVTELLQENSIPVMKWPANSPDLNPIENLWRDIKIRFNIEFCKLRMHPSASQRSYEIYEEIIKKVWAETDWVYISQLIESMPRRVQAVIDAKGGHTKY